MEVMRKMIRYERRRGLSDKWVFPSDLMDSDSSSLYILNPSDKIPEERKS